jgi:predicted acetyltransferase
VVVPGDDGGVDAFASFTRSPTTGILDIEFGLECEPLAAVSERGLRSLLAYFRGYRGVGQWLRWTWAPHDPVAMLIPEHAVQTHWRFPWMFRLLHLEGALRGRGWPPGVRTEALFAVEDPLFRANTGTWRLTVGDGEAGVVREADHAARKPIPIGALSSMFSGYLRPQDAVRIGMMDPDDPAVGSLAASLAGPDPWTGLFF